MALQPHSQVQSVVSHCVVPEAGAGSYSKPTFPAHVPAGATLLCMYMFIAGVLTHVVFTAQRSCDLSLVDRYRSSGQLGQCAKFLISTRPTWLSLKHEY
ncbi:hypothetical protein J6590_030572 [Homalodisca vitripennis]|nr:hypothetical protein J6590_030572 [Homalodisca vitripennis]